MAEHTKVDQAIERVILANPRADVAQEHLAAVAEAGRVLISAIPGVEAISWGISQSTEGPYQWYVRIRFRDEQALQTYQTHPNHVDYGVQQWLPIIANQIVIDYRIQY